MKHGIGTKVKAKGSNHTTGTVVDTSGTLVKVRHNELMIGGQPFEGWGPASDWEEIKP